MVLSLFPSDMLNPMAVDYIMSILLLTGEEIFGNKKWDLIKKYDNSGNKADLTRRDT